MFKDLVTTIFALTTILTIVFIPIIAWFTHLFHCFADGTWGFLIAGAIFFPIGIIHGIYLWFV